MRSNEKPGAHLPHDAPALEAVRSYIRSLVATKECHELLIGNFDQVWSLRFRPKRHVLQKQSSMSGQQMKDPLRNSMFMRRLRHNLELCLDLPVSEANPGAEPAVQKPPQVTGGKQAASMVDEWRVPRTVTTLSWIDGGMSRSHVTLREGTLPEEKRQKLNAELKRFLVIEPPQPKSHMWTEQTLVNYLRHLSQERCSKYVLSVGLVRQSISLKSMLPFMSQYHTTKIQTSNAIAWAKYCIFYFRRCWHSNNASSLISLLWLRPLPGVATPKETVEFKHQGPGFGFLWPSGRSHGQDFREDTEKMARRKQLWTSTVFYGLSM